MESSSPKAPPSPLISHKQPEPQPAKCQVGSRSHRHVVLSEKSPNMAWAWNSSLATWTTWTMAGRSTEAGDEAARFEAHTKAGAVLVPPTDGPAPTSEGRGQGARHLGTRRQGGARGGSHAADDVSLSSWWCRWWWTRPPGS